MRIKTRCSFELGDGIYVKGYGFLSFTKNMSKSLSNKYGQKFLDSAKNLQRCNKNCFKKSNSKTAEATGDLIGNKIADKISASKKKLSPLQNDDANSEIKEPKKDTYLQKKENKLLMN